MREVKNITVLYFIAISTCKTVKIFVDLTPRLRADLCWGVGGGNKKDSAFLYLIFYGF